MNFKKIQIEGYEQNADCAHCGRVLKHGIRISTGEVVGAQCFDKVLTAPREYLGKKYRCGAPRIIELAKIAQFYTPASRQSRFNVDQNHLTFTAAV